MKKIIYDSTKVDKETLIQDLIEFRNYLYQRKNEYDRYNELRIEQINVFEKNKYNKYLVIRSIVSTMLIALSAIMYLANELYVRYNAGGQEGREIVMRFCPHYIYALFVAAFAGLYYLISTLIIHHTENKMKEPALSRIEERERINEELKEYYNAYDKPQPISYRYSNPAVLQTIINNLKRDDIKTLYQAIEASEDEMCG